MRCLCSGLLFLLLAVSLSAQGLGGLEDLSDLLEGEAALTEEAEVVVTAARYPQRVDRTPSNVFVITREQLQAMNAKSLADALRFVPGFTVFRRQQLGHEVSAFGVGGQFSNKILVLLDGHRITEPAFGSASWQDFPLVLEEVDRIEVVQGPESTLYGSNAFAGVVNILTGAHLGKEVERLSLAGGNRGYSDLSYHRSTRLEEGNLSVSLRQERRGGFGGLEDGAGNLDPFFTSGEEQRRRILRLVHESRPGGTWNSRWSLALTEVGHQGLALAPGSPTEQDGQTRATFVTLDLDRALRDDQQLRIRGSFSEFDRQLSGAPFTLFGIQERQQGSSQLELEVSLSDRVGPWKLAGGLSGRRVTATSYLTGGADDDALTSELFLHGERDFGDRFVLFLGVREIFQQLASDELSWKIAGLYRPRPDTALRLSLGTSFRQPDLVSARFLTVSSFRGAPTNQPLFATNPNLGNEVAQGFVQFGMERRWHDSRAKVDFYTAELEGIIDLVPFGPRPVAFTPAPTLLPIRSQRWENGREVARVRGVTVAFEKSLGELQLQLGGHLQDVDGLNGFEDAPYAPPHSESLILTLPSEGRRCSGSLAVLRTSATDVDVNARQDGAAAKLPGYTTVDLHIQRVLSSRSRLGLSVRNLFDQRVREMIYSMIGDHQEQGVRFGREVWLTWRVDL